MSLNKKKIIQGRETWLSRQEPKEKKNKERLTPLEEVRKMDKQRGKEEG